MSQENEKKTSAWIVATRERIKDMLETATKKQKDIPAQMYVDISFMMRRVDWLVKLQGKNLTQVRGWDHTEADTIFRLCSDALDIPTYS